jgi:hypothetical protein
LFDGLDLATQTRETFPADLAQYFRITPFAVMPVGPELAFQQFALGIKLTQHRFDCRRLQLVARRYIGGGEWTVSARVTANYFRQRVSRRLQKRFGQTWRQGRSQGIAVTACIFGGEGARFAGNAHAHGAPGVD